MDGYLWDTQKAEVRVLASHLGKTHIDSLPVPCGSATSEAR